MKNNPHPKNLKLVQAMKECAISQIELAKASGVGLSTIRRMVFKNNVRAATIRKVCFVLQRTPVNIGMAPERDIDLDSAM